MSELSGKIVEVRRSENDDVSSNIGEALKEMRRLSGLSQSELARRLDVGKTTISRVETGKTELQVATIQKFVEALGGRLHISASFDARSPLSLHIREAFEVDLDDEDQLILPMFAADEFRAHRDVVLSIRPQYSSRILTGEKTVELRRRFPVSAPKGTIAYIYSTSPERAMVGVAEIADVKKLRISEIWRQYSDVAFIERGDFDSYFQGVDEGFALEFSNVKPFTEPLSLAFLREKFGFEPPQSFLYAKKDLRRALRDEYAVVSN